MGKEDRLVNYIRVRRRQAGLSQRELAQILGYRNEGVVSRHERFRSVPPLLMALGYEVVFQTSVSELFPGLRQTIGDVIESSLTEFESTLRQQQARAARSQLPLVTRKLDWLEERWELSGRQD
jgi:transcriptional regulator with XRE-family HTH domain